MRCGLEATPLLEGAVSGYISVDQPMQVLKPPCRDTQKGRRLFDLPSITC
jgi:hypothetical protein